MYDKLMGLTFVEPRVSAIASIISTALDSIPKRGPITGATLLMLQGLVSLLRNPRDIVEHGQKILEGQTAENVLSAMTVIPPIEPCAEDASDEIPYPNLGEISMVPALESCGLW